MNKTLTFSEEVRGWPSFYSFYPDWMQGMNNYFYTWNGGNLYRHNVNETRNEFYGVLYPSYVKTVLNDVPLENKIFKTIALVGDDPWDILSMETDLQSGGNIESSWFEEKESTWFAYVRNSNVVPATPAELHLRSLNGIGRILTVSGSPSATNLNFAITPSPVVIGSIVSVGDYVYYSLPPYTTPVLCGEITSINVNYRTGVNQIIVDTTIVGGAVPPIQTAYILTIKNQVAESHGCLGHYCVVELENNNTEKVELFALQSDVSKSFP